MSFLYVGLSHKGAPVEVREAAALDGERLAGAYAELLDGAGVDELVLLSTCNRVEAYASVGDAEQAARHLRSSFERWSAPKGVQVRKALVELRGDEALWHLLQVASSLDSMVLGEAQILGQVKDAYDKAVAAGAVRGGFHGLFQRVFAAAKEVRTRTEIGRHPASIPSIAVQLAQRLFGELEGRQALLLGAGEMAELTAEHLQSAGVKDLTFSNRSMGRAKELAKRFNGRAVGLEALAAALPLADVVVCSTGAPEYILGPAAVRQASVARDFRNQLYIDISVPRNIDPSVGGLENTFLYNLDDLDRLAEEHRGKRQAASQAAELLLRHRQRDLRDWLGSQRLAPVLGALSGHFESVRKAELQRQSARLKHLSVEDLAKVEYLTQALVKKLLDSPIRRLKRAAAEGDRPAELVESVERLFDLQGEEP